MSWNQIDSKTTKEYSLPLDGTGTIIPKVVKNSAGTWYLRSHYVLEYKVVVKQDSSNKNKYRVECRVRIANCYHGWGGEWTSDAEAYTATVLVNGDEVKSKRLSSSGLSCYDTSAGKWHEIIKASDFFYEFNANDFVEGGVAELDVGFEVNCHQDGAGRASNTSWLTKDKQMNTDDSDKKYTPSNASKATASAGFHGYITKAIKIELYKEPTITISNNPNGEITKYNVDRKVTIGKNTSIDTSPTTVKVKVKNKDYTTNFGNNGGQFTFKPSDANVSDAEEYTVTATRTHNKKSSLKKSASVTLKTYTTPRIKDISLDSEYFSGTGNGVVRWKTNGRMWTKSLEDNFITYYQFDNKGWKDTNKNGPNPSDGGNKTTYTDKHLDITTDVINDNYTLNEQCVDKISTTLQLKRVNPTSGVEAVTGTKNIEIQFTPKYSVINVVYKDSATSKTLTPGSIVITSEVPKINVSWSYTNSVDRGILDGYLFEVYSDSSMNTRVYYTYTKKTTIELTTRNVAHMNRGTLNYIKITPYHIRPDTNKTKAYGPVFSQQFVLPVSVLSTPVISYPISNTSWHNKNFRILFQLPQDGDNDVLESIISNDTYEYQDIEVVINDISYKYSQYPNIFSIIKLGYMYKICVNPSLIDTFPFTYTYRMKVRVQKKYFVNLWSEYSKEVTLNIFNIVRPTMNQNQFVMASHFNTVQSYSQKLHKVYPINDYPNDNQSVVKNDFIHAYRYQAIYDTLKTIQNGVNNWARFDDSRNKVKFNDTIIAMSGSTNKAQSEEIITAEKTKKPQINGRNYLTILLDCMDQLY